MRSAMHPSAARPPVHCARHPCTLTALFFVTPVPSFHPEKSPMANVRLTLGEASEGFLPETCMKCGANADYWVKKKLAWHPSWLWVLLPGLIPFVIIASILTKRATLIAPLCRNHRRHWVVRTAITLLGLLGLVGIIVLLIAVHS